MNDPDFFIIGLQKSGTYGLSALLDAHPQIRCLPNHPIHNYSKGKTGADEGRIFDLLASAGVDGGEALRNSFLNHHGGFFSDLVEFIGRVSQAELYDRVKKRYLEWFDFHNPERKPIVGDKTTEYVFHLDLLDQFFPRAKKLCIIRDPRDRVVSWYFHQLRKGRTVAQGLNDEFIKDYVEGQIKKEYASLLAYDGYIYCLRYESLKHNPKAVLPGLLDYLGADSAEGVMESMCQQASFENLRHKEIAYLRELGEEPAIKHYRQGKPGEAERQLSPVQNQWIVASLQDSQTLVLEKYQPV